MPGFAGAAKPVNLPVRLLRRRAALARLSGEGGRVLVRRREAVARLHADHRATREQTALGLDHARELVRRDVSRGHGCGRLR